MTLFDFLAQAGFWQWLGILSLASIVCTFLAVACQGLGKLRVQGDITSNKTKHIYYDRKEIENKTKH